VIRLTGQPEEQPDPKKPADFCEEEPGFGTAKAVIASRAVTVHASTLRAPSQELAARA
jgi:hypothetical protein